MVPRVGEPGGDEQGADLVAVQAGGVGLVVQSGSPYMGRRRDRDQAFLFGVAVETGNGAQPAGDRGPGPAQLLVGAEQLVSVASAVLVEM